MASHRHGTGSCRTMIPKKNKTSTSTILLSLMTMTVLGINDQVACWPMVESPPSSSTSSPSPSSSSTSPTFISASEELDSDASRKVLGSSVVTSVSVVMSSSDGKSNSSTRPAVESTVAIGDSAFSIGSFSTTPTSAAFAIPKIKLSSFDDHTKYNGAMNHAQLKSNAIPSPGNFLNPDKYEFYTFDESGDLVKKLMSWDEIQGLIAASDTDGLLGEAVVPIYYNENANSNANGNANAYIAVADKLHGAHLTANEIQTSDIQDVRKVVESVQNVLKSELAAVASSQSKIIPAAAAMAATAKPSSLHSNSPNWSSLFLPNFLDNLDEDAFVNLQHHHLTSDDSLAITSPVVNSAQLFNKTTNQTTENNTSTATTTLTSDGSSSSELQTRTTPAVSASSVMNIDANNSEKHSQSTSATFKTSPTPSPPPQKFTPIKNTASKPTNFKYSSSATSEKIWSMPNSIVSDEKPTKNYIMHSSSTSSTSPSPSTPMSTSSPLSSFSTYSHSPTLPLKSHWSTKTSPNGIPAAAITPPATVATPKPMTVTSSNGISIPSQSGSSAGTTNRNSFPETFGQSGQFSQINNDQQQMAKIKPGIDFSGHDSSPKTTTTAKHHYTSYFGQRNNATMTNFNSVPMTDREKINVSQLQSSSQIKNSTDKVTATSSVPYTRYTGNSNVSNAASDLATRTTTDQYQHNHGFANSAENSLSSSGSASSTSAQSSLSYRQSPTSATNSNSPSWKINGISGSGVISSTPPITSTSAKLNSFTPFRTTPTMAAANSNVMAETAAIRMTPSTNGFANHESTSNWPTKIRGGENQPTTTAEPLVTWISTNNFDDRVENKNSNGQILDSDKLVTEQYVSGTAPGPATAFTTSEQLVSTSKDTDRKNTSSSDRLPSSSTSNFAESFTKKTTIWGTTFSDNSSKTNFNADGKKPATQSMAMATSATTSALSHHSPSSSYHTWSSAATTSQPSPNFVQQPMIPNRVNSVHTGGSGIGGNVESKTAMTPNSNNHHLHHNHHIHHQHHHHPHEQSQQQNQIPNRNSGVTFSSFYHRDRPSASPSSSSTLPDTNFVKYTKTPSSLAPINATTSNEMVMQRIPTLDPPNKIASPSSGSQVVETIENDAPAASMNAANNAISSSPHHHSSTESAKNLTQIAVMVNKSNNTQMAMTKNSYNKNVYESKHRPSTKPNHFYDSTVSNTPTTHKKYNTNDDQDKTQPTVKPINVEFLNDCITSFISNSMVSGGGGGGGNNDREHETSQSLSYNGNVGNAAAANASHDNHYHHYNLHHQDQDQNDRNHDEDDNFGDKNGDYRQSTAANYVASALFSRDQTKYNTSSGASFASAAYGATHAANTGDNFQQKVTLPSVSTAAAAATAEKQKENSHIYYYKLPPINSQPLKANANTITAAISSSASSTASTGSSHISTISSMTTAAAPAAAATATWTTVKPTSQGADKTYQKITTVNRPSSSTVSLSTNSQNSLHTEARISSSNSIDKASTISIQDTTITRNSAADSSIAADLETREATSTTFHQIVDMKSSQSDEIQGTSAVTRQDDEASTTGDNFSSTGDNKLKNTMASSNGGSTRRTEPIATPQVVTVSLNFSSAADVATSPTTPVPAGDLSDLRKEDSDDKGVISITNDDDDDENENDDDTDDDEDDNGGYSSSSEDEDGNDSNGGNSDDHRTPVKEQAVENDDSQQINRENDHRHKAGEETLANKNQRVANVTAAQFWPVRRKTTPDEFSSRDRTRTNAVNKNFTTYNQDRIEMKTTPTSSWSSPQKNGSFTGTTSRSGDVNSASSIVATASTTTTPTTFGTFNFSSSIASLGSTPSVDNEGGFVRVKLENRTTPSSSYNATPTSASANKQKEDKIKLTLSKNQPPSKQSVAPSASSTAATISIPSSSPPSLATNSANVFRSPGATPTLARPPQPFTSGFSANSAASPIGAGTPTTTPATWTTNGNSNAASVAVELHPAPHENMGLEASIAYLGDDVKTFIDLCNELSFKIWTTQTGKSLTTSRSIVLSPFALLSTLAMIFLGARGSSSGIMNDFLRLDDMVTFNPHQVFRNITESAVNSKNTGAANVAFVRQVFSDKTKGNVLEFYKERLQQYYDTYVEEINFNAIGDLVRRRTNLLVKRQTQGRIQDYLRGSTITMKPPLATFTANIFQTDCSTASTEGRNGEMYFVVRPSTRQRRLVPIPAVVYRGGFLAGYEPGLDATAVTLSPESVISTILVLPGQQGQVAPGDGLARLEQRLLESSYRRGAWSRLLRSLLFRHGLEVQIPRFSHKSILNLTMGLQRMGMGEIFTPDKADLRGINGLLNELHLSDCVQANTFSTCGEESVGARHHIETFPSFGQRPGAGRGVDEDSENDQETFTSTTATPPPPLNLRPRQARLPDSPRLRFDRPFLYIVRHNPTGMILYIGRFNPRLLP